MKVNGRLTVAKFKKMFKDEFGVGVRVYNGVNFAKEDATLASIRKGEPAKKSDDFEFHAFTKVGNAEKEFKDVFAVKIQIENKEGELADDKATLASLKMQGIKNMISKIFK